MPRTQLKLMAVLAGLVVLCVLASGYVAERGLRARELASLERSLRERAELVRELVGEVPFEPAASPRLAGIARRAAAAAGARVTLVAADGAVVADSDVPLEELARVESHADRPEVRAALAGEVGQATRRSETVFRPLFYLAVPVGPGAGVVRVAVGLDELEAAVAGLRRQLLVAGGFGLAAALTLSFLFSAYTVRPLGRMRETLAAIARGDLERRLPARSGDELGEIARAVNAMAGQLRLRLDQITAEKEQLHAVLSSMVEGVLVLDSDGRIVMVNPRARELLSIWGPAEGRKLLEVARHPGIDDVLREAPLAAAPVVSDMEVGGRAILLHAVRFPAQGPPTGSVAVLHDVSELRHLENVRRDFVANASHELQTPLTAIRGFAETLLANSLPPEKVRSQIEVILRNAERLGNLIRDMLELSRIESRRVPLQASEVDVVKLTRLVLRDMEPRMKERSLQVSLEQAGAVPAWADRRALEQVLTNLLDNAVKYTDPGGTVSVQVGSSPEAVRISVRDTGIGIPAEDQARIFERFYRVDKARSRALGGTGLGLAIVKHLVQAMEGDIYVESRPGQGSTFRFSLPRADRRAA